MNPRRPYFRAWWFYTLGALLFVLPNVFAFGLAATTGRTIGDIIGFTPADLPQLVGCLLALIACLLLPIAAVAWVPPGDCGRVRRHTGFLTSQRADLLLLAVLIANGFATLAWDVGALTQDTSQASRWAFVLSLFPLSLFFLLYYVQGLRRGERRPVWLINTLLFAAINLARGWTGQLLLLAFWLLVYTRPRPRVLSITMAAGIVAFIYLYPLLDAYKLVTRGVISQVTDVSPESPLFYLEKLMGRLSPFSNAIYIQSHAEEIAATVAGESGALDFLRDIALGVVPKKLLGYDTFATYNQILNSLDAGTWITSSSFNVPFSARLLSYWTVDASRAILFACTIVCLVVVSTWMLKRTFGSLGSLVSVYTNCELLYSTNMIAYGYFLFMVFITCLLVSNAAARTSRGCATRGGGRPMMQRPASGAAR